MMMRILSFCISMIAIMPLYAAEPAIGSYQQAVDQYMKQSAAEPSPFTAEDMAIMDQAAKALQQRMPSPGIKVGERAPDFSLPNAFGEKVFLKDRLSKGPVVLVFYRGAWCPFCNMHLHALQKNMAQLKQYGAQLIAVTPQTPDKSADQIRGDKYPFEILSDLDSSVIKSYKLFYTLSDDLIQVYKKHGLDLETFNGKDRNELPVPGTFVIDQKGIVRAMQAETDYTHRMEPEAIIEALKTL